MSDLHRVAFLSIPFMSATLSRPVVRLSALGPFSVRCPIPYALVPRCLSASTETEVRQDVILPLIQNSQLYCAEWTVEIACCCRLIGRPESPAKHSEAMCSLLPLRVYRDVFAAILRERLPPP